MIDQPPPLLPASSLPLDDLLRAERTAARRRPLRMAYALAVLLTLATMLLRLVLGFTAGDPPLLILFTFPIVISAYLGGLGPGLLATVLAALLSNYVLLPPQYVFSLTTRLTLLQSGGLFGAGILISVLSEELYRARVQAATDQRLQSLTLASIGDGVITINVQGRIIFLNAEAARLTGWSRAAAVGQPVAAVFRIADAQTSTPITDPAGEVLYTGVIGRLAHQTVLLAHDGRAIPIEISGAPTHASDTTAPVVVLVFRDISLRAEAETAQARLAAIVESSNDAIIGNDLHGMVTSWNASAARLFGFAASEMIGQSITQIIPLDRREEAETILARIRRGEQIEHFETVRQRKDGTLVDVSITASLIRNRHGQIIGVSKVAHDISSSKRAEQALRQSEAHFATAFRASPAAMSITSLVDGRFIDINTSHERLFGYARNELIGQHADTVRIFANPDQRAEVVRTMRELGGLRATELTLRTKSGELLEVLCSIENIDVDGEACILGNVVDITDRKRMETALRASEARFRQVFLANPSPELITRVDTRVIVDANPAFAWMTGYAHDQLLGQTTDALGLWPDSGLAAQTRAQLSHAGELMNHEIPLRTRDESVRNVLLSVVSVELDGVACFLTVMLDQTERKRAERALQRHSERLQHLRMIDQSILIGHSLKEIGEAAVIHVGHLLPTTRVALVLVDAAAATLSSFALQLRGEIQAAPSLHAPLQIMGDALAPLTHGQVYAIADLAALPDIPPVLRAAQVEGVRAYFYTPILAGGELIALLNIGSDQPSIFTTEHFDIAREVANQLSIAIQQARLHEATTRHAQELEGRVAARTTELTAANKELEAFSYSVSHDLRAPLRAIDGFSRILLEDYIADLPEEAQRYFHMLRTSAQQMDQLVNDLLAFSRLSRQPLTTRAVDSAALVRQCIQELNPEQAGRRIEISSGELPMCQGDPVLLKQVWLNLLSNALKYTRQRDPAVIAVGSQVAAGGEIIYFVRDNGAGFDMRYSDKLFGVFQRMHRAEDYEGIGVGLAIVQRIIHRHGGRIWAEAAVDRGAKFSFTLEGGAL